MSRPLGQRLWPWGVALLVLLSWDRAGWLYLSPRDDARAAETAAVPVLEEDNGQVKAISLRDWAAKDRIEGRPWYMLLYVFGRYEPWLILSAWLVFSGVGSDDPARLRVGIRRAVVLSASILAAGIAAELLKDVVRRGRPEFSDGWFVYLPWWASTPAGMSYGMPSSHAAVAFAAAIAVGRMVPSTRWVLYPLALGCAACRVIVGAHFLSDAYIGALLGVLGERAIYALAGPVNQERE